MDTYIEKRLDIFTDLIKKEIDLMKILIEISTRLESIDKKLKRKRRKRRRRRYQCQTTPTPQQLDDELTAYINRQELNSDVLSCSTRDSLSSWSEPEIQ